MGSQSLGGDRRGKETRLRCRTIHRLLARNVSMTLRHLREEISAANATRRHDRRGSRPRRTRDRPREAPVRLRGKKGADRLICTSPRALRSVPGAGRWGYRWTVLSSAKALPMWRRQWHPDDPVVIPRRARGRSDEECYTLGLDKEKRRDVAEAVDVGARAFREEPLRLPGDAVVA